MTYDAWKCTPPDEGPDAPDPHEHCEAALEAAEQHIKILQAQRRLTYAELVRLVGTLLPGQHHLVTVTTHGGDPPGEFRMSWQIAYGFTATGCTSLVGDTAREVYDKLRAAVPTPPGIEDVGDIPW